MLKGIGRAVMGCPKGIERTVFAGVQINPALLPVPLPRLETAGVVVRLAGELSVMVMLVLGAIMSRR